jgi:hypothetical protein
LKPPTRFILETNGKTMDKNDEKMETIGKKNEQTWKAMENQGTFWKTYPIVIESYRHKLVWKCLDNQKKQRQFKH